MSHINRNCGSSDEFSGESLSAIRPRTTIMNEQIRADFESYYSIPADAVYNESGDHYGWASHPQAAHPIDGMYEAFKTAHARYAMPECHSVIDGKRTEDMTEKELRYHLQESSRIMQQQADEIAELRARYAGNAPAQPKVPDGFMPLPVKDLSDMARDTKAALTAMQVFTYSLEIDVPRILWVNLHQISAKFEAMLSAQENNK